MTDQQFFGLIASLSLLIWLLGPRLMPGGRRDVAAYIALGLVGAGILYALFQTVRWYAA
ncbi:MAG: hypothetical protein U1E17_22235 [Geminicoccaceae bacterium]